MCQLVNLSQNVFNLTIQGLPKFGISMHLYCDLFLVFSQIIHWFYKWETFEKFSFLHVVHVTIIGIRMCQMKLLGFLDCK